MNNAKFSKGQNIKEWENFWNGLTPDSEIKMWDYYGLRHWILKYTHRFGKVVEAGCGLGRYNFYLSRLGINIEGVDFYRPLINYLNEWKNQFNFNCNFLCKDITNLPYENNSLSGYLSFGVVEHFIEGPQKPLKEAYRVLKPGGIAIISTPAPSWSIRYKKSITKGKKIIKKILNKDIPPEEFFQYEYSAKELKRYLEQAGFYVSNYGSADLLYTFLEFYNFNYMKILNNNFIKWFSNKFENTILNRFGAQSICVGIKLSHKMYCFLDGKYKAPASSLDIFTVPLCDDCSKTHLAEYYRRGINPKYSSSYLFNPKLEKPTKKKCTLTGKEYTTDHLFEDYGFDINVSPFKLKEPVVNIKLSNENIRPIWRPRKI